MKISAATKQLLLPFIYLALFFGVYYAFTNNAIYHNTLSKVVKPYQSLSDQVGGVKTDKPYTAITNENIRHWDSSCYYAIGTEGYEGYYTNAFFPLFPLVYKLTGFTWLII